MKNGKWETISSELAIEHPFLRVTMNTVLLPDGQIIDQWPIVDARDYVNALIINGDGEGLVLEGYKHGHGRITWQTIGGYLEKDEDPFTAIQRELLEEAGLTCRRWKHLSSFVVDANRRVGVGHFFLGYGPVKVAEPDSGDLEPYTPKWVNVNVLKQALWDGRIGIMSHGINVALALLALEKL